MLDTDIASYAIKGVPAVRAHLSSVPPSMVCISVITRAELLYGLQALPASHRLHAGVRQFLRLIRVLSRDADAADFYVGIRHQLVSTGQTIGDLDMMIAAHSLSAGAVLVTNNQRHFSRVAAPLSLVKWT